MQKVEDASSFVVLPILVAPQAPGDLAISEFDAGSLEQQPLVEAAIQLGCSV